MEVRGPVIWMFIMCCIFRNIIVSHHNEFVEAKSFSKSELDLEIEKRLKTINKPAVKIIKTIDGERYGCVDFFKQPAFDHPSMKNHTYHYKMRPIWKGIRERKTNNTGFGYLWENGVGCPIGTVPIQRVTKDDLLRLDSFVDNHKPRGSWNTTTYNLNNPFHPDQHHYAIARTKDIGRRFHGATMELCITAPKVKPTQFSNSRLHIQMGRDFLQAGLTVNPLLYKDKQPRTFVYTSANGKSCYNSNCNVGMVVIRHDLTLGLALQPVSTRGSRPSYYTKIGLVKDRKSGNWLLKMGGNYEPINIGLWPGHRFQQGFGDFVEWGGEVYSAYLPSPQMGYGYFPIQDKFAVARTKNIGKRFNGATTALCITAPKVKPTQFSNSRLHMQMGRDFVQAGLTVNPVLYKDMKPRTFVFTYSGGRSCYNNNCDTGIIVIRHDFPLGMSLPASIRGAKTSNYGKFSIVKDTKYGWWYQYGVKPVEIGLWPERRFQQSFGDFVEWGGEVYSASLPSPQMGYGYFPIQDISYDAYIEQIAIFDDNYNIDRNLDYLEVFSDNNRGYRVIDTRDPSGGGHVIFYGGPGNI